jgi:hypothetical protein
MSVSEQDREDYEEGLRDRGKGIFDQALTDVTVNHPDTQAAASNSTKTRASRFCAPDSPELEQELGPASTNYQHHEAASYCHFARSSATLLG